MTEMAVTAIINRFVPLEERADDHEKRIRSVESRLSWIMGGLAILALEVPVVVALLR